MVALQNSLFIRRGIQALTVPLDRLAALLRLSRRKTALILLLIFGLLLIAIATSVSRLSQNPGIVAVPDSILAKRQAEIQQLIAQGKYTEAHKLTDDSLAASKSRNEKYELYLTQGNAYRSQNKYDEALAAYRQAAAVNSTYATSRSIGQMAQALNDRELAIDSYNLAMKQIVPGPYSALQKSQLEKSIALLR